MFLILDIRQETGIVSVTQKGPIHRARSRDQHLEYIIKYMS